MFSNACMVPPLEARPYSFLDVFQARFNAFLETILNTLRQEYRHPCGVVVE